MLYQYVKSINKRNEELQHVSKGLCQSKTFLSQQLPIDFYILMRSITSHNKKSFQQSLKYTTEKVIFTDKKLQLLLASHNMNYPKRIRFTSSMFILLYLHYLSKKSWIIYQQP